VKTEAGTVVIARRVAAGKEEWFSGGVAGLNMNGTWIEVGDPPHPLTLPPPGKTIETVGDKEDYPYLSHLFGAKLVSTSTVTSAFNVTAEGAKPENLVGPPATQKLYDLPPDSTPYERVVVYRDALTKSGWTILRTAVGADSLVVAQYNKNGRDIYVYLHDRQLNVIDVGAQNEAKALAAAIAKDGHVAIYGIYFDIDKDTLQPASDVALEHILQLLKSDPKLRVEVQGHTDNTGTAEHNQTLSEARAKSVQKWLVAHGIAENRLVPKGYGDTKPVAKNDTPGGRAQNRRVELQKI
jgi:outer membrane protein OmpA-like peptidoglycan-associated protein